MRFGEKFDKILDGCFYLLVYLLALPILGISLIRTAKKDQDQIGKGIRYIFLGLCVWAILILGCVLR